MEHRSRKNRVVAGKIDELELSLALFILLNC